MEQQEESAQNIMTPSAAGTPGDSSTPPPEQKSLLFRKISIPLNYVLGILFLVHAVQNFFFGSTFNASSFLDFSGAFMAGAGLSFIAGVLLLALNKWGSDERFLVTWFLIIRSFLGLLAGIPMFFVVFTPLGLVFGWPWLLFIITFLYLMRSGFVYKRG